METTIHSNIKTIVKESFQWHKALIKTPKKTKYMLRTGTDNVQQHLGSLVTVDELPFEVVKEFLYLRASVHSTNGDTA